MIRILAFITLVLAFTFSVSLILGISGQTVVLINDTEISAQTAVIIICLLAVFFLTVVLTLATSGLIRLPKSIARRQRERRQEKGLMAFTRGLEAVAAGDAKDAQRYARIATRQLDTETRITRLLTAQAAQLAGDEETAEESFAAMLEAPETEFLGLRGLYLQSMNAGDRKEAREYAERAFRLRPGTEWAYQSVYTLHLDRGAWGDARDALLKAQQHGLESGENAQRREAALLTAMAYAAETGGDHETARQEAEEALKKAPGFAPAAVLAARMEALANRRSKAGKILDEAWAVSPHPAIAKTMSDIYADENIERRADRLKKLADKNPDTDESILLIAEQESMQGNHAAAKERLEPLMTRQPRARTFSTMATAVRGLYGAEAAQVWLDRAASAPLDPVPGADGDFHFTTDGWRRLITEFGDHGRMAPPPLEELRTSLTVDEVQMLLAPPVPPEAPDTAEPESPEEVIVPDSSDDVKPVEDSDSESSSEEAGSDPDSADEAAESEEPTHSKDDASSQEDDKKEAAAENSDTASNESPKKD